MGASNFFVVYSIASLLIAIVIIFLFLRSIMQEKRWTKRFIKILVLVAILASLYFIYEVVHLSIFSVS